LKKNNNDLIVGGVIFISLFILIAGVLWLKETSISRKTVQYTVLFPNIGSLQNGDPVMVNGVKCGLVSKIYLYQSKVAVLIKIDRNVTFTDSSTIAVQNIGLMGERMVGILLSDKGKPHLPDTREKIHYIHGSFDSGIAEAMGMLGSVLGEVLELIDTVQLIVHKTVGDTHFVDFFNTFFYRLDSMVYLVDHLIKKNESEIQNAIKNVSVLTSELKKIVKTNKGKIDNIVENGAQLSNAALLIAEKIDSVSYRMNNIVSSIDGGKGTIGRLVKDESIMNDLKTTVNDIDSLVHDVKKDALKLRARIKLFGNKKYFKEE
jgi:phospholipid/cholesterol/gamma-HCH transport system substrate-binding protein